MLKNIESYINESEYATVDNTPGMGAVKLPNGDMLGSGDLGLYKDDEEEEEENIVVQEMGKQDIHFQNIITHYNKANPEEKKRISIAVAHKKNLSLLQLQKELLDLDYNDVVDIEKELGIQD